MNKQAKANGGRGIEEWRDIPGYEGVYQASSTGMIRRIANLGRRDLHERVLIQSVDEDGYHKVELRSDNRRRKFGVHQLIALAFIGICPEGFEVNHIDLNKSNNIPSNLEYITHVANIAHARAFAEINSARGSSHGLAKLDEQQVSKIKQLLRDGHQQKVIAAKFGVNHRTIYSIASGRTWRHVQ